MNVPESKIDHAIDKFQAISGSIEVLMDIINKLDASSEPERLEKAIKALKEQTRMLSEESWQYAQLLRNLRVNNKEIPC